MFPTVQPVDRLGTFRWRFLRVSLTVLCVVILQDSLRLNLSSAQHSTCVGKSTRDGDSRAIHLASGDWSDRERRSRGLEFAYHFCFCLQEVICRNTEHRLEVRLSTVDSCDSKDSFSPSLWRFASCVHELRSRSASALQDASFPEDTGYLDNHRADFRCLAQARFSRIRQRLFAPDARLWDRQRIGEGSARRRRCSRIHSQA